LKKSFENKQRKVTFMVMIILHEFQKGTELELP